MAPGQEWGTETEADSGAPDAWTEVKDGGKAPAAHSTSVHRLKRARKKEQVGVGRGQEEFTSLTEY